MTLVNNHDVPGTTIQNLLAVRAMYGLVNARDNQLIFQCCIAIGSCPLPKLQFEASKFSSHVSDSSRWSEIQNSKTGMRGKQLLDEQPNLHCFSEPHFVRNQDTLERRRVQDVAH